jgi:asparagine synthase (glutamine-hydrolysing)
MCGIAGLFDTRGRREFSRALVERMNDTQFHRGPDEGGIYIEPGVALAHRRLSIIDLATGQQPLSNGDGSVVVVFNGEIYNFQSLAKELEDLGYRFRTRSDTEVIVHAWSAWGGSCVKRFRGMFAFALWDRKRRALFLARDRMGVKPLYYSLLPDGIFMFGSELKALMAHPALSRDLDPRAVEQYFALGYVPDPHCIYGAVRKLPAAHSLEISANTIGNPRAYWDVEFTLDSPISPAEAADELRERVAESVKMRLLSEVPLGAFLSGGVDSSAVVATMATLSSNSVRTCSIGFDESGFDESGYALMVAKKYRTDHRSHRVRADDFSLLDTLAWHYDEPFADNSALPTYRVCQLARRHVTVALSGDGGDESLAGYGRYRMHTNEERVRAVLPIGLRRMLFGPLGLIFPKADWAPRQFRAKTTFQALARDTVSAYAHTSSVLRADERERLYSNSFLSQLAGYRVDEVFREHAARAKTNDPLALVQYLDYKTYLVGDINTKVDRASMANSLEVREPLMDHLLIEWLATLPSRLKLRGGEGKWIFKKAFEQMLPAEVLHRRKMGFSVPMARWLRGPLAARTRESVLGARLAETELFDAAVLSRMVDEHMTGRRDFSDALWALIMFDAFLNRPLARPQSPPLSEVAQPC